MNPPPPRPISQSSWKIQEGNLAGTFREHGQEENGQRDGCASCYPLCVTTVTINGGAKKKPGFVSYKMTISNRKEVQQLFPLLKVGADNIERTDN